MLHFFGKAYLPWCTTDPNVPLRARDLGGIPFHIPDLRPDIIEGLRFPLVPDAQHCARGEGAFTACMTGSMGSASRAASSGSKFTSLMVSGWSFTTHIEGSAGNCGRSCSTTSSAASPVTGLCWALSQPSTRNITLPRSPSPWARSYACRACASGKVSWRNTRSCPSSIRRANLGQLRAIRFHDEERVADHWVLHRLARAAMVTSVPPDFNTPRERWRVSPPTVSSTASMSRTLSSNRVAR